MYQDQPELDYDPVNQRYLVVWRDDRSSASGMYGQLITFGGELVGINFAVELVGCWRYYPETAANTTSGGYLTAWRDERSGTINVYGRQVSGSGALAGSSFPIGPVTGLKQYPWAAFNAASREYLLVWEDYRHGAAAIYGQRLNEAAEPVGDNIRLSDPAAGGEQRYPRVAAAGPEGYLVLWEDRRSDSGGDIYGQRVAVDGSLAGGNVVAAATAQGQTEPDLAFNPDTGRYLAVWRDKRLDTYGDIYGQFITIGGVLASDNFVVSAYGGRTQEEPGVVYNRPAGQFLVVWSQWQSSNNYDIYGQQLSGQGALLDNPGTPADESTPTISFALTTQGANQLLPRPAVDPGSGRYLVVWQDYRHYSTSRYDLYGQLLNSSGALAGSNLVLSTAPTSEWFPAAAGLSGGQGFLVVWQRDRENSWRTDVAGLRLTIDGGVIESNPRLVETVGWLDGVALAAPPDRPEALLAWEWDNEIYTVRYSVLAANFTAAPRFGSAPLTVSFTNPSTPTTEISSYLWDFGDGTVSSDQSAVVSHTYSQPGVYTVTLTATGPGGANTKSCPACVTVNSPFTPHTDLLALWRLDESGGLRLDRSGQGHYLAPVNGPAWAEAGRIGSAVDLEKDVQAHLVVAAPLQSRLGISGSLTLLGWVKPESSSSNYMMLAAQYQWYDRGQQENAGYRLSLDENNRLYFVASADGTAYNPAYELKGATALPAGTWAHVAAVFDAQARELRLYVNGVLDNNKAVAYDRLHISTAPFMLGANLDSSGNVAQTFDGLLDEWRVYNRALSLGEIEQVRQVPGAAFTAAPRSGPAPLAVTFANTSANATRYVWDFGDGTVISDQSSVVSHTYPAAGVYTVTLLAGNGAVTDTLVRPAYILATSLTQDLRGYWRLDETGGLRADSSGRGNHLSDINTVGAAAGRVGLAADLERDSREYLSVAHSVQNGLAITGSLALAGWLKMESGSSDYVVVAGKYEYGLNNRAFRFGLDPNEKLHFVVSPNGQYAGENLLVGATTLQTGVWYHVAAVFEAASRTMTLYLNGQPDGSKAVSYNSIYLSSAPFMLGANMNNGSAALYFDGLLDEWRVYARPLSQAEIQGLMTTTPPAVAFGAVPRRGPAPLTVTFSDGSTGPIDRRTWAFGDGTVSSDQSAVVSHTYPAAGVYTVSLTISGPGGESSLAKPGYITVTSPVAAGFSAFPLSGPVPLLVQFLDNSTGAASYQWDFGDPSPGSGQAITSTLPSPTHTYAAAGVYTVTQTVSHGQFSDTLVRPLYITAAPPQDQPVAGLSAANNGPTLLGQATTLTATLTGGSNVTLVWDFGDGITQTIPSSFIPQPSSLAITHTYPAVGEYTAVVTAGNSVSLLTATTTVTITTAARTWRPITTTVSPPVVGEHAMAYDPARDVVVLYGGNADGWPYEDTTWEFDVTDWLTVTTTTAPTARYGATMVYLPPVDGGAGGGLILFGGSDESDAALDQTWVYTAGDWSQLHITGPLSRTYHSLADDPEGILYLFGGNDGETYFNDLWQYKNGGWIPLTPANDPPPARTLTALTYDSNYNRLLLFGGRTVTGTLLADLWAFDPGTNRWTELDDGGGGGGPPARMAHSLTYDPTTGKVVLVGGVADVEGDTLLGDTWHCTVANGWQGWQEVTLATALPPRAYHRAVYTGEGIFLFSDGEGWKYE